MSEKLVGGGRYRNSLTKNEGHFREDPWLESCDLQACSGFNAVHGFKAEFEMTKPCGHLEVQKEVS